MEANERMLTIEEVADRLRVSIRTARKAIVSGRIKAVRVSEKIYRVPESALVGVE